MKNKIELLIPVGDFECLKAAVQNGADAVYLGVNEFNARYSAENFTLDNLEEIIDYAHLRNVQVHLTLNILIKNNEFQKAINIAKVVYEAGIDAIIVQDLGLALYLINNFPNLPIHASTQMTCHNLLGAKYLEQLGFKRIVLSRELSIPEIEYIKSNVKCEIEVFGHGALCISYSGQCLYSSLIGGRSGNRGKCAQGCRLPYELLEDTNIIDKGYLLSPRDLSSLELLPELLNTNIDSLKIEGRMKSPEYVATVTRIYRKYINKIINNQDYIISATDKKDLLQVFNRGNFSSGHLKEVANRNLIFKEKPNNMGIYIGQVNNYNSNKGHVSFVTKDALAIGDTISFEKENTRYTISELMQNDKNIKDATINSKIKIGRMKGNINIGDKIYKLSSKQLSDTASYSYSQENIKTALNAVLNLHLDSPISLHLFDDTGIEFTVYSKETPDVAVSNPISKERIKKQLEKTGNTPFYFKNIKINMDNNLHIPHISTINELRRLAIEKYSSILVRNSKRTSNIKLIPNTNENNVVHNNKKICVLLNTLNLNYDYSLLRNIDKLYIPLKYFCNNQYKDVLNILTTKFNTYIYMPSIMKANYRNLFKNNIDICLNRYNIKGFVISNIGYFELLKEYKDSYEFISNYTLNIFNNYTIDSLNSTVVTISPELNKEEINNLSANTTKETEFIVYGNIPLMTSGYCLLGVSNKCYPECNQKCNNHHKYYLKDRMNFNFRIIPDNIQTITTIYNSKTNSIDASDLNIDNLRIDILDESVERINQIIYSVKSDKRLEGQQYTNGNLNRFV